MKRLLSILLLFSLGLSLKAVDFRLRDFNNRELHISELPSKYTLLLLYNSACDLCDKAVADIRDSQQIDELQANGHLTIITVAMFEEGDEWKGKASAFPDDWLNCTDAFDDLLEGDALDFDTVPVYFLLDKKHNTIATSTSLKKIERLLRELR